MTFGGDLIQSLNEALAHAKGEAPAVIHAPAAPREARTPTKPTRSRAYGQGSLGGCWIDR